MTFSPLEYDGFPSERASAGISLTFDSPGGTGCGRRSPGSRAWSPWSPGVCSRRCVSAIQNLPGFTTNSLGRNDDGSSSQITLPFSPDFFGVTEHAVYVNNNGNITFDSPLSTYTPFALNTTNHQIIAPFFADVDTIPSASGIVTYGTDTIDGHAAFGVDYFNVAYYCLLATSLVFRGHL